MRMKNKAKNKAIKLVVFAIGLLLSQSTGAITTVIRVDRITNNSNRYVSVQNTEASSYWWPRQIKSSSLPAGDWREALFTAPGKISLSNLRYTLAPGEKIELDYYPIPWASTGKNNWILIGIDMGPHCQAFAIRQARFSLSIIARRVSNLQTLDGVDTYPTIGGAQVNTLNTNSLGIIINNRGELEFERTTRA